MTNDMIGNTLDRLKADYLAFHKARRAVEKLEQCEIQLAKSDLQYEAFAPDAGALVRLTESLLDRVRVRALARACQLGWQVATYEIAPEARGSGTEPVVFITGNSHMPPLRAFGISDDVWRLTSEGWDSEGLDLWESYVEGIEDRLAGLQVAMECPEYDNALYVVDLARFQYVEDAEGDSLSDEWEPVETTVP